MKGKFKMKKNINFLDLGLQPLANNYINKKDLKKKEKKYRLKVGIDLKTKLCPLISRYQVKLCLIINIHIDLQCLKL